jgi:hypothetical protein
MRHTASYYSALFAFAALPMMCPAQERELAGTLLDTAGRPVSRVSVVDLSRSDSSTKTESDGSFSLRSPRGPILIKDPLFAPLLLMLSDDLRTPMKIVLKERSNVEWRVPACAAAQAGRGPTKTLLLPAPRGVRKLDNTDADYELISFMDRTGHFELRFWKHVVSYGLPTASWFKGLTDFTVRPLNLAGTPGYDIVGTTAANRRSRWTGCMHTLVEYTELGPSTAKLFDSMIKRMCYR